MACFRPLQAWQLESGEVVFAERGSVLRPLELPCGQCVGCRLERSRRWAVRCMHESQMHEHSSFVTLTYSDDSGRESLRYRDFQLFMKRLRKEFGPVRFFMCGEYGELNWRPHYHAVLFGVFFADRVLHSERGGFRLYRSPTLERLWPLGFSTVGDVSFESAAYTARYIMKKVTGEAAEAHYRRVSAVTGEIIELVPEFARMSLRPGIGAEWFEKYRSEVFGPGLDRVVVQGRELKPPRYYRQYLDRLDPDLGEAVDFARYEKSGLGLEDRTEERLRVREAVASARVKFYSRNVE